MDRYAVLKRNRLLIHAATRMNFRHIMLNKRSQTHWTMMITFINYVFEKAKLSRTREKAVIDCKEFEGIFSVDRNVLKMKYFWRFMTSFFHSHQKLDATKMFSNRWMDKSRVIHPYKGIVFNHNKKCAIKTQKKHGCILHAYSSIVYNSKNITFWKRQHYRVRKIMFDCWGFGMQWKQC